MDSAELSRKVAEAMGWRKCERPRPAWDEDIWHPAQDPTECSENCCPVPLLDLADARDREAAIAWLNAKGWNVHTDRWTDRITSVSVIDGRDLTQTPVTIGSGYGTAAEALGRAFLAAMGVQG